MKVHAVSLAAPLAAVALFLAGYAAAQQKATPYRLAAAWVEGPKNEAAIEHEVIAKGVNDGKPEAETVQSIVEATTVPHKGAVALYGEVVTRPDATDEIAERVLKDYYYHSISAKSAVQASQASNEVCAQLQSLQVAQNARIIQLLQKIADKK